MPNVKSAKKRLKTNLLRNKRNRAARSAMNRATRAAQSALEGGDAEKARPALARALGLIGKNASKGVIHMNRAARLESRLVRKSNVRRGS